MAISRPKTVMAMRRPVSQVPSTRNSAVHRSRSMVSVLVRWECTGRAVFAACFRWVRGAAGRTHVHFGHLSAGGFMSSWGEAGAGAETGGGTRGGGLQEEWGGGWGGGGNGRGDGGVGAGPCSIARDVTPDRVLEARGSDVEIDAGRQCIQARAGELGLGVGQLDAGGASVLEENP